MEPLETELQKIEKALCLSPRLQQNNKQTKNNQLYEQSNILGFFIHLDCLFSCHQQEWGPGWEEPKSLLWC